MKKKDAFDKIYKFENLGTICQSKSPTFYVKLRLILQDKTFFFVLINHENNVN